MRRQTQNMLYHLLPAFFWLLAIGGSVVSFLVIQQLAEQDGKQFLLFIPAVLLLIVLHSISRIERHGSSVEQCVWLGLLMGIASYWLPTVVFLIVPIWIYLIFQNKFSFRSFLSTLIGMAVVAIWAAVFIYLGWMDDVWTDFFAKENAWGWIPTGATLVAWVASTIARQNLRAR